MAHVKMVQRSKHKWYIKTTEKNVILQDDITISSPYEAEEFIKKYISSFMGWTYDIVKLEDKK